MSAGGARWLVTCSCGWTRECVSRWGAQSVTKLHPRLAPANVEHVTRIEPPPNDTSGQGASQPVLF